jgi:hypothetical protein
MALDVDVVSISWFSGCSPDASGIDQLAIKEILDSGTSIVVAAANGPTHCGGGPTYPFNAGYDERVIVVTSTGKDDAHGNPSGTTHSHYADWISPHLDMGSWSRTRILRPCRDGEAQHQPRRRNGSSRAVPGGRRFRRGQLSVELTWGAAPGRK